MKTILYLQSTGKISVREKLTGFYRAARNHPDWNVQVIEPGLSERQVGQLLEFWKPSGVIVAGGDGGNAFDPAIFGRIPVVYLGHRPHGNPRIFCVTHESQQTAALAARELLTLNLAAYAFVPFPRQRDWSDERLTGFVAALKLNGRGVHVFDAGSRNPSPKDLHRRLADWLAGLPRPLGVFAANDHMSAQVLAAAQLAGLRVPDDVAIIGVDNDELVCENAGTTLSSIVPDFAAGGEAAGNILSKLMSGHRKSARSATFGPLRTIRRASTMRIAVTARDQPDHEIQSALDLIRRNACQRLKACDVLKSAFTGCSRRTAELRFRAAIGHSILDEIRRVRLECAREMLKAPDTNRTAIANKCGYANPSALWKLLRSQLNVP